MAFKPVDPKVNFPELEKHILKHWYESGIVDKYLHKNDASKKKFSFLDGPITANNPMAVHHAWGRTYKDVWQRYHNMKGEAGRFQNGFDCQGLWVEVEVEKELGFKSKKDIETYGVAAFVNKCKDRVNKYSAIQTEQSRRLGYFMDWDHSYYTMSDENNYAIWGFLQECWRRGWLYKGHDVVPWCPRCETAISQHEILTEDYKQLTHESVFVKFPLIGRDREYLLIWTTTPWTLIANTAVAVDRLQTYNLVADDSGSKYWVASGRTEAVFPGVDWKIIKSAPGDQLLGLHYQTPFDQVPVIAQALKDFSDKFHVVVGTDPLIMPISETEGTGLVHTSTSTGEEDHQLGKKLGLPVIPAINDTADYLEGFGQFSGQNAKKNPGLIISYLGPEFLFKTLSYTHRYPACWRCKTELVWKVADEWYISMDKPDPTDNKHRTFRRQMIDITAKINWLPAFGLDRELDWLKNMHDWLISKKNRYWGLALPIYVCPNGHFEVLGSYRELEKRAVSGWSEFSVHSPHKPWIDAVKINCSVCGAESSRIADVGNPWLDAGIVAISTLPESWFPAEFITESFPGQFKNWFYSLIAMSTVIKKAPAFKNVLGYASVLAENGLPMHKSAGNAIEFNDGADKIGVDVMRWIFARQNPEQNLLFGFTIANETRRQFHLLLWNIYNFFVTYANIDKFDPNLQPHGLKLTILDRWIIARLNQTIGTVTSSLESYDAQTAVLSIEEFVSDLSLWFVRRSRDRVGPAAPDETDKLVCHSTLYSVLCTLTLLLAPFTPYLSEEIYQNLTMQESVHLTEWPRTKKLTPAALKLISEMKIVRKIVEAGLSARKTAAVKVRQPLRQITVNSPNLSKNLTQLIKDELNIKKVVYKKESEQSSVILDLNLDSQLLAEGQLRELIRSVQEIRKSMGAGIDKQIKLYAPLPDDPKLAEQLRRQTLSREILPSAELRIELL